MVQLATPPVQELLQRQRDFFNAGHTRPIEFRIEQLQRLKQAIAARQDQFLQALKADLGKPDLEAYLADLGIARDINYVLTHLKAWVKPRRVAVPLEQMPASAKIYPEPLGVVLLISPWNYPVHLAFLPLVGAIAAGNCAILKPSEIAPQTSRVIAELIQSTFDPAYVAVVEGGVESSQALLAEKFDHIFFTGSTHVGKIVMAAAAQHLTPVTLELGGKSPCIVAADADLKITARRIMWGKFINMGQTCIAPDYVLVDRQVKAEWLAHCQAWLKEFYGEDPAQSPDLARIVSDRHFQRLQGLLSQGDILVGGHTEASDRYIAPTLMENVPMDAPLMQEEIFGPILPILTYDTLDEAIALINQRSKPLALYLFSRDRATQEQVLSQTSSGGVCLNDVIMHIGVPDLPFGGVGDSGMGAYHGKATFDTFSHYKSVLKRSFWPDLDLRYPPYVSKIDLVRKVFGG
jgi:aldehyde dehydrogenase (NAD+)